MKRVILFLFLLSVSFQPSRPQSGITGEILWETITEFVNGFNKGYSDRMYDFFDPSVRQLPPFGNFDELTTEIKRSAGNVENLYTTIHHGNSLIVRCLHEKMVIFHIFTFNDQGKIIGYLAYPYSEKTDILYAGHTVHLKFPAEGEWFLLWGGGEKRKSRWDTITTVRPNGTPRTCSLRAKTGRPSPEPII